ncbi:uncharacterized protein EAF02_007329 [Botrytis sinoallii]|uniref:uncharacterized protein n=1 Tax=Botrytis sinoallii TaxID=1463999 RepID=UPI001902830F|nr:uncharacterized protein EAF02_007329 [Botrytis sinoallii]KAF7880483.1 hypothetical protein EAF02_007329 [Botrytis sinoallii]
MPSLKQDTMNTIAAAVAVKDDDPRMQDIQKGLGHILKHHLDANSINHQFIDVNKLAVYIFKDMVKHFEMITVILQLKNYTNLRGGNNAIDPRQYEEMINLAGDEHVTDLTDDEDMVDLTGDEHVIDLTGDEDMVDLTGDEHVIDLTGDEDMVDLTGDEHVIDLTGDEDVVDLTGDEDRTYSPPPPYCP